MKCLIISKAKLAKSFLIYIVSQHSKYHMPARFDDIMQADVS